ncbi:MAG: thioredoxin domain-containing protein [Verrucomicrobiota bacterium]
MKTLSQSILVLIASSLLWGASASAKPGKVEAQTPKVIAMYFYADWCAACKALDPKFSKAREKFDKDAFLYAKMDVTNLATSHQSGLLAAGLGLKDLFDKTGVKTGFVYLVNPETNEVVDTIKRSASADVMAGKIKTALGS